MWRHCISNRSTAVFKKAKKRPSHVPKITGHLSVWGQMAELRHFFRRHYRMRKFWRIWIMSYLLSTQLACRWNWRIAIFPAGSYLTWTPSIFWRARSTIEEVGCPKGGGIFQDADTTAELSWPLQFLQEVRKRLSEDRSRPYGTTEEG